MTKDDLVLYEAAHGRGGLTNADRAWDLALAAAGLLSEDGMPVTAFLHAAVGGRAASIVTVVAFAFSGVRAPCTNPEEARIVLAACALARILDDSARASGHLPAHLPAPPEWVTRRADEARVMIEQTC